MLLTGCNSFKQDIGLEAEPPDEFAVESRAPLSIPPEFSLRPPDPGAPRPQEVSAASKAQQELNAAGPGQPGDQASALPNLPGVFGGGPNPQQQVAPNSLSEKLLSSNDIDSGATIESRQTSVLKGVY